MPEAPLPQRSPEHALRPARPSARLPFLLYGVLCCTLGLGLYLAGVLLVFPRYLLGLNSLLHPIAEWLVWYSGLPLMLGIGLAALDLLLLPHKAPPLPLRNDPAPVPLTVLLTAYDDELSIAAAVADFRSHPAVRRVIVVSNNSRDATMAQAAAAGAIVLNESQQGYGHCVYRCLREAARHDDTPALVLCEGDRTFRAADIDKLLAYAPHADIVNGTRTAERLRSPATQLTTFMYYGNLFVGKLLEAKHLGRATVTDVGATYKLVRKQALAAFIDHLDPSVNLEFNAHFLDVALTHGTVLVEVPITFHPRVGQSKGGNTDNMRACKVGLRMMAGLVFGWRWLGRA